MTMKRLSLHALSQTRKNSLVFIYMFLLIACSKADREQDDNAVHHRVKVSKTKSGMTITSELNAAGQKDGSEVICYSNNALFASRRFKSGLREGRAVSFFMPNYFTKPLSVHQIIYFKNDKQNGKFYSFYENGKIEYLQRWRNGNIVGDNYFFDNQGRLECKEHFGPEEKITSFICYDSVGRILKRGTRE